MKKPRKAGRPRTGKVALNTHVLPATLAALRADARRIAIASGNRRIQLGAAVDAAVAPRLESRL